MSPRSFRRGILGSLACVWLLAGWLGAAAHVQTPDPLEYAAAVRTFNQRIDQYVVLRARLEEPLPSFNARRDPWSLMLTRRYLASALRAARPRARQGDIFTPEVASMFRTLVARAFDEIDIEGLVEGSLVGDDDLVDLTVNEPLPAWAMTAVPGALRDRLPPLPDAIEYRIVGGALVLWDAHAEILIDALPNAFAA